MMLWGACNLYDRADPSRCCPHHFDLPLLTDVIVEPLVAGLMRHRASWPGATFEQVQSPCPIYPARSPILLDPAFVSFASSLGAHLAIDRHRSRPKGARHIALHSILTHSIESGWPVVHNASASVACTSVFGVVIATSMAASSVEACAPLLADSLRVRHAGGVRKGAADRRGICYSFTSHVEPCFVSG